MAKQKNGCRDFKIFSGDVDIRPLTPTPIGKPLATVWEADAALNNLVYKLAIDAVHSTQAREELTALLSAGSQWLRLQGGK